MMQSNVPFWHDWLRVGALLMRVNSDLIALRKESISVYDDYSAVHEEACCAYIKRIQTMRNKGGNK